MNIAFYTWNKPRKSELMQALENGATEFGHDCALRGAFTKVEEEVDVAVFMGCNIVVKKAVEEYSKAGKHYVYFDKGYLRYAEQGLKDPCEYYRVAIDCFQPSQYIMELGLKDDSRWGQIGITPKPWRSEGSLVLYADSSDKYKEWFGWSDDDVSDDLWNLRVSTQKTIVYRPRNCEVSIYEQLDDTWALVTRGSNAAVDAILYGVPVVLSVDSRCISSPLANRGMVDDQVYVPSDTDRHQWLCGLAWCQFTVQELSTKFAWSHITERLEK